MIPSAEKIKIKSTGDGFSALSPKPAVYGGAQAARLTFRETRLLALFGDIAKGSGLDRDEKRNKDVVSLYHLLIQPQ